MSLQPTTSNYFSLTPHLRDEDLDEYDTKREPGFYSSAEPEESIGLHAWEKISKWRAREKGSIVRKSVAEMGYFGSTVFSILEAAVRLPVYWVVCNTTSKLIAQGICRLKDGDWDGQTLESYVEVRKKCMNSYNKCIQAIAQNTTSLGTNLVSHELNMNIAQKIGETVDNAHVGQAIVKVAGAISPGSIISAVRNHSAMQMSRDLILNQEDY